MADKINVRDLQSLIDSSFNKPVQAHRRNTSTVSPNEKHSETRLRSQSVPTDIANSLTIENESYLMGILAAGQQFFVHYLPDQRKSRIFSSVRIKKERDVGRWITRYVWCSNSLPPYESLDTLQWASIDERGRPKTSGNGSVSLQELLQVRLGSVEGGILRDGEKIVLRGDGWTIKLLSENRELRMDWLKALRWLLAQLQAQREAHENHTESNYRGNGGNRDDGNSDGNNGDKEKESERKDPEDTKENLDKKKQTKGAEHSREPSGGSIATDGLQFSSNNPFDDGFEMNSDTSKLETSLHYDDSESESDQECKIEKDSHSITSKKRNSGKWWIGDEDESEYSLLLLDRTAHDMSGRTDHSWDGQDTKRVELERSIESLREELREMHSLLRVKQRELEETTQTSLHCIQDLQMRLQEEREQSRLLREECQRLERDLAVTRKSSQVKSDSVRETRRQMSMISVAYTPSMGFMVCIPTVTMSSTSRPRAIFRVVSRTRSPELLVVDRSLEDFEELHSQIRHFIPSSRVLALSRILLPSASINSSIHMNRHAHDEQNQAGNISMLALEDARQQVEAWLQTLILGCTGIKLHLSMLQTALQSPQTVSSTISSLGVQDSSNAEDEVGPMPQEPDQSIDSEAVYPVNRNDVSYMLSLKEVRSFLGFPGEQVQCQPSIKPTTNIVEEVPPSKSSTIFSAYLATFLGAFESRNQYTTVPNSNPTISRESLFSPLNDPPQSSPISRSVPKPQPSSYKLMKQKNVETLENPLTHERRLENVFGPSSPTRCSRSPEVDDSRKFAYSLDEPLDHTERHLAAKRELDDIFLDHTDSGDEHVSTEMNKILLEKCKLVDFESHENTSRGCESKSSFEPKVVRLTSPPTIFYADADGGGGISSNR